MAPSVSTRSRRKPRFGGRIVRGVLGFVLIVGLAYLIHQPLVHLFHGTRTRIQTAGEGPTRLFGGRVTPTIAHWLTDQQLQTGAARSLPAAHRTHRM